LGQRTDWLHIRGQGKKKKNVNDNGTVLRSLSEEGKNRGLSVSTLKKKKKKGDSEKTQLERAQDERTTAKKLAFSVGGHECH